MSSTCSSVRVGTPDARCARSADSAYERVCRDLVESRVDTFHGGEVTVVRIRRGRPGAQVVGGEPGGFGGFGGFGGGHDSGLAGVREPQRPKPGPPSLSMELDLPRGG